MVSDFLDAAVLLVGHGSTKNASSSAAVLLQARSLRERGWFGDVKEAFWKQDPHVEPALASVTHSRVFIIPFFASEGYFSEKVIPAALGFRGPKQGDDFSRVLRRGGQTLFYCRPLGTHGGMTEVLLGRARQVLELHPFPVRVSPSEAALVIAGHGTPQDPNSRKAIERQVERIRHQGVFKEVFGVYLEEEPRVDRIYEIAVSRNVVVVPFFMGDGPHVAEDIPQLLGEPEKLVRDRLGRGESPWRNPTEKRRKLVWCASSVGDDPRIPDLILRLARESAAFA